MDTFDLEYWQNRTARADDAADRYQLRALDAEDRAAELEDRLAGAENRIDDLLSRAFDAEADAHQAEARAEDAESRLIGSHAANEVLRGALDRAEAKWAEWKARATAAEAETARLRPIIIELRTAHEAMHTRALDAEADAENQFNRADDAEAERDGWFSAWESASAAELRERARAERAEDRAEALHVDFATAAFAWEKERAELKTRAEKAEAKLDDVYEDLGGQYRRAEQAERDLRSAESDLSDWRERAEKAETKESDRLRDHMTERRAVVDALGIRIEDNPADELVAAIDDLRVRAEKAEAELVEWKARHEGIRLANEVMRGQLERANARLDKAEPPKPRAFRDAENDVWVEVAPGRLSGCWDYDAGVMDLSITYANVERSEVEATWGPLREIAND